MASRDSDAVLWEVRERVATITINRPEARNSLTPEAISILRTMFGGVEDDPNVGAVVLRGAGGKAFCTGADLSGSLGADRSFLERHEGRGEFARLLVQMNRCKKPILAAVEGYCLAGGLGICLSCDVVMATEDSQFGLPEIQRGLWPYMVTAVLIRNVGRKKAIELCMTAERIGAQAAERMGMINHCVPGAEFPARVEQMAKKLASFSPVIMGLGKRSFYTVADMPFDVALDYLNSQLTHNTQCEDLAEGITAFLQKREPQWKGR
jgi:enoyl-CoA hydratase/carnithine racemase